jgi:zinc transporter ZupT
MSDIQIPSLVEFLKLLTTTVGIGAVVSFVLANLAKFNNISSAAKFWIVFAISMGLPLLAALILNNVTAETLAALEPYWNALAAGFAVFIGSQVFYAFIVKRSGGGQLSRVVDTTKDKTAG